MVGHKGSVYSLAISLDGKYSLSSSEDKTLKLWNLVTGEEIRTFVGHSDDITIAAISPDGQCASVILIMRNQLVLGGSSSSSP